MKSLGSRNTVKKYLASEETNPQYQRKKTPSKLDDYEQVLNSWLHRKSKRPRKQRKTAKSLYSTLVLIGYSGSYDRVAAFAPSWKRGQGIDSQAVVPLRFSPAEAFQFDWSEDYVVIAGSKTKLQVAHIKLIYSRAFMVRAYLLQTHEMLFNAHFHSLSAPGGVPERGIYDNMKTAVDKVVTEKDVRLINAFSRWRVIIYLSLIFVTLRRDGKKARLKKVCVMHGHDFSMMHRTLIPLRI